ANTYIPYFSVDLESQMYARSATAYMRIPFEVTDREMIGRLTLWLRWDDGFIAYLNGVEVLRQNAPDEPVWNSVATATHPDSDAVISQPFDISTSIESLVDGTNVLAIHALNRPATSSDFLMAATLTASELSTSNPSALPMHDDGQHGDGEAGDGVFGAIFPPTGMASIRKLFISAETPSMRRDWPGAPGNHQSPDALIEISDDLPVVNQATYRVVMTPTDYTIHRSLGRSSNALINATFIAGDSVHYFAGLRFRGNSSRSANPPPVRVNLPADQPFGDSSTLNLNSVASYLQVLGMRLFQQAGIPTPDTKAVQVLFNSENRAGTDGFYAHVEPLGDEFIDNHLPEEDRGGNMYKKQSGHNGNWTYRGNDPVEYQNTGWEKRNNSSAADWQDLIDFHIAVNTLPTRHNYLEVMEQNGDIDQWLRWYAVNNLINNRETNLSNGADDDYTMYRRPSDGRWIFLPHDLDSILGRGQSGTSRPEETIFQMLTNFGYRPMERVRPLFDHPEVSQRYYAIIEELLNSVFAPRQFGQTVDTLLDFVDGAERERLKQFMLERREHILEFLYGGLTV
ncbi:MAG: CotH kinase family protein, partial [Verrucomicrobiales bacterium]